MCRSFKLLRFNSGQFSCRNERILIKFCMEVDLKFFLLLLAFTTHLALANGVHEVSSPDGAIRTRISLEHGQLFYGVTKHSTHIVKKSRLGMVLRQHGDLSRQLQITQVRKTSKNEKWQTTWGEHKWINDNYHGLVISLLHGPSQLMMDVEFRVFNDGVAFNYAWPGQKRLQYFEIDDEVTEFRFNWDDEAWWIPAFEHNRYEYLFQKNRLSDIDVVHTPVTLELRNGYTVALHEAKLVDFASMALKSWRNGTLKADLVPWMNGPKVKVNAPHQSPWRMIIIANKHKDLIESTMMLNLNDPPAIDASWVYTGKFIGMWWGIHIGKYTFESGSRHGATTENVKRYIDFAARHGFQGVLVEGWNIGWDGGWMSNGDVFRFYEAHPNFNADFLSKYAKSKGVRLVGHHETSSSTKNYERQMVGGYDFLNRHHIDVVKTGYVGSRLDHKEWHHGQYGVQHYAKMMKFAADKKVMQIVHEPIKQTGLQRTYPNLMAAEGARGQEYDAWSPDGGNPPDHTTILPFTRMLAGPMDFTPGTFDLQFHDWRPHNRVNTTLAKQLALFVVIYSPWPMASDLPENYEKFPEAFEFIKRVPTNWNKTVALESRIGDYTVIARQERNGPNWYLGAITDENGRSVTIELDFLDKDAWYTVNAWQDARSASWSSNPYAMEIYSTRVQGGSSFDLHLAPGGGLALEFIKLKR
jgi:alpha-glucosidase